jgi:putative acetyltransferase
MPEPVQVRVAAAIDSPGIVRVVRAVFDEYHFTWDEGGYHADLYEIDAHYTSRGHAFYVAEAWGVVVGTAALERFQPLPGEPGETVEHLGFIRAAASDCALERLYVHPDARRQGIGAALIERVIGDARQENKQLMEIWSDKRFRDAHRLYERFGARNVGERICHDPDKSPEWGLVVRLGSRPMQTRPV